jgi:4a-hydroxytetrahydrobiopterin dehydratase
MHFPDHWNEEKGVLARTFTFSNFVEAVAFVDKIVPLAEKAQHHPDINIFGFKNVKVMLCTHDAGSKITRKDVDLARKIDVLFVQGIKVHPHSCRHK